MANEKTPKPQATKPDLESIETVIADPLRFKRKLMIGDDAYALMRARKRLQEVWDVGGMAMTGAGAAASPFIASTFFASTGGVLSFIGIGSAAATPVGWVLAAGLASGGLYYGVTKWVTQKSQVDVIPRFINTPLDILAMSLLDLMGVLAFRVAGIDGKVTKAERTTIQRHFIDEWGYDAQYVAKACYILEQSASDERVKDIATTLAQFQAANPDCKAEDMQKELLEFLRQVVEADGVLDEREELAIDAISSEFRKQRKITLAKMSQTISDVGDQTGAALIGLRDKLGFFAKHRANEAG